MLAVKSSEMLGTHRSFTCRCRVARVVLLTKAVHVEIVVDFIILTP